MDLFEANEGSFNLVPNDDPNDITQRPAARVGNACCNTDPLPCSGDTFSAQVLYINFRKHCGRIFNGFTTPATLPANTRSLSGVVSSKYT